MEKTSPLGLRESLTQTYNEFSDQLIAYAPQLAAALALLLVGLIVSHLLRIISRKLVGGLDSLFQRAARTDGARQEKIKGSYAVIVSKVVFWTVMIFFIAATANMLGWQLLSSWMASIITYLPNLITGALIILAGFLLSSGVKTGVISAANSAGLGHGEMLARMVQGMILFTTLVIGIEQIGINVHFLPDALIVTLGVLLAGCALAFGLGAQSLIANIIGAQYVSKHCRIGEHMQMRGVGAKGTIVNGTIVEGTTAEGTIVEVTQTSIVLDTESGRTVIPAKHFQEQVCNFTSRTLETASSEATSSNPTGGDQ